MNALVDTVAILSSSQRIVLSAKCLVTSELVVSETSTKHRPTVINLRSLIAQVRGEYR